MTTDQLAVYLCLNDDDWYLICEDPPEGKSYVKYLNWGVIDEGKACLGYFRTLGGDRLQKANQELRSYYLRRNQSRFAERVGAAFSPTAFASWFQARIGDWATEMGIHWATPHIFRKTALQHARRGEDLNRQVAQDAKLNVSVMLDHYVDEEADQLRHASNRTFQRILASLPVDVAVRYGHKPADEEAELEKRLLVAAATKDWTAVADLADKLRSATN